MTLWSWDRPHPRVRGVVAVGAVYPAGMRAAKNAHWYLITRGRIEPAGWGDLSGADLERLAGHLHADEIFLPVREGAGIHLGSRTARADDFDWSGDPSILPPVERFADSVNWVVLRCQTWSVTSDPDLRPDRPPGGGNVALALTVGDLRRALRRSVRDP